MNTNLPSVFDRDVWLNARIRVGTPLRFVHDDAQHGVVRELRYSVTEDADSTTVQDVEVRLEWTSGGVTDWTDLAMFRRDLHAKIPAFASTEEADSWLDAQAADERKTHIERELDEMSGQ